MIRPRSRSGKTNLFSTVQKLFQAAVIAKEKQMPADELLEQKNEMLLSRRRFLEQTSKAALITALGGTAILNESFTYKNKSAEIIIVGGGIAGLTAAYYLKQSGYNPQIYEASNRTGGRMYSAPDMFFPGSHTELGGEFIDTGHKQMWRFIKEFDLDVLDVYQTSELQLRSQAYYFNGQHYSEKEIIEAFIPIVDKIVRDQKLLSDYIYYNKHNAADAKFDKLSIAEYFDSIGATGLIRNVLDIAYITEYGEETGNQSALNFLTVMGTDTDEMKWFGVSDERYKIVGGNQRIPDILASKLTDHIHTDHYLGAIKEIAGNKLQLEFMQSNGASKTITADRVILTLPFTMLKDVEMQVNMPQNKIDCIQNLGYGKNAKLFAGFNKRVWREQGYSGAVFTDNGFQMAWDNTQLQQNEKGGLTIYTGGNVSNSIGTGTPAEQVKNYLPKLNAVYPGTTQTYNNISERMYWPGHKYTRASYLSLKPGQYITMSGLIGEPAGNIYFAGEHCSYDFQGFMNGGATTGKLVAKKVMQSL